MLSHGDRRLLVHEMKKKDAQAEDLGVDVDFDAYDDFADSDIEDIQRRLVIYTRAICCRMETGDCWCMR